MRALFVAAGRALQCGLLCVSRCAHAVSALRPPMLARDLEPVGAPGTVVIGAGRCFMDPPCLPPCEGANCASGTRVERVCVREHTKYDVWPRDLV